MCFARRGNCRVIGFDSSLEALDKALEVGAITERVEELPALCYQSDVVFIATPISVSLELLPKVLKLVRSDCIVTDVCSTKQGIVDLSSELCCGAATPIFIGGHPMAGSERGGIGAADPYLFENALYVLTPSTPDWSNDQRLVSAVARLTDLLKCTGARLAFLSPSDHDVMAAVVSHLPHMIAAALVKTLESYSADYPAVSSMAAGGFRDATRVAKGDALLWRDILSSNSRNISAVISTFVRELQSLDALVASGRGDLVAECLRHIAAVKDSLPQNLKGLTAPLYEVVVAINDEPGKISGVASLLAQAGINIKDIEIVKIREGEGGTLRLGFSDQESSRAAQSILSANGYRVRER